MTIGDDIKERMQQIADALDTSVYNPLTDSPVAPVTDEQAAGIITRYGYGHEGPKATYPRGYPIALPGIFSDFNKLPGVGYRQDTFLDIMFRAMSDRLGGLEETWNYLDAVKPTGMTNNFRVLYQFDTSSNPLNDKSGNGRHLSVHVGTPGYTKLHGRTGVSFDGATVLKSAEDNALALAMDRECTLEAVLLVETVPPGSSPPARSSAISILGDDSFTEEFENNAVLELLSKNGVGWYAEHETGRIGDLDSADHPVAFWDDGGYMLRHRMQHVVLGRAANGYTYTLWVNGELVSGPKNSTGNVPPEIGGSGNFQRFNVGGHPRPGGGSFFHGVVFSIRAVDALYTSAMVTESYRRVRGLYP